MGKLVHRQGAIGGHRAQRINHAPERLDLLEHFIDRPALDEGLHHLVADVLDDARHIAVLARRQENGRGRFGRVWHSGTDGNLYASFAFQPQVEPARMQTFTLWMGVNICALVASFCRTAPGIKWPNDLLFEGRKAGGMLTEARMDADRIHDLVFGLGLNLAPPPGGWPAALAPVATSLAEHTGRSVDANKFAAALVGRVFDAYTAFLDGSFQKTFANLWNGYDLLRGRSVTLLQGNRTFSGVAAGIDDEGSLLLRLANGHTDRFRAGEVTIAKK